MSQTIDVNMTPGLFMPTIYYSQGDIGREFKINITTSDGTAIPAGATVKMQATKPSGLGFSVSGTLSGNVATFVTTETMTNEAGRVPAELVLEANGDRIGTANFYWQGEKDPHPQGTVDGDLDDVLPKYMTVTVTTLPAGSNATYYYNPATNNATFGIPRGADGSLASGVLASTYSSSSKYAVGDYVYYSGSLYRCTTAITTPEAWTSGHWRLVALANDTSDLKNDIDTITAKMVLIKSVNLCESDSDFTDGYVSKGGNINASNDYQYSKKIPVSEGDVVRCYTKRNSVFGINNLRFVTAYDSTDTAQENKGDNTDATSYTVPSGISSVILSVRKGSDYVITKNATVTQYEPYFVPYYISSYDFIEDALDSYVLPETTPKGYNLVANAETGEGAYYWSNGVQFLSTSSYYYYIMPVKPNTRYMLKVDTIPRYLLLVDDDENMIIYSNATYSKKYIDTGNGTKLYLTYATNIIDIGVEEGYSGSILGMQKPSFLNDVSLRLMANKYACTLPRFELKLTQGIDEKFYYSNIFALPYKDLYLKFVANAQHREESDGITIDTTNTITAGNGYRFTVYDQNMANIDGAMYKAFKVIAKNLSNCSAIVIGDSEIEQGKITQGMLNAFTDVNKTLTLYGTRGTAPNLTEGRAGWLAKDYCTEASIGAVTNAFWNPNTSAFDFSYYMNQQGYSATDFVIINLGTNDLYNADIENDTIIPTTIAYIFEIIESILAYNPSQKIILNLPSPPNGDITKAQRNWQIRNLEGRFSEMMQILSTAYSGSNLRLSYTHLILDPFNDIRDNVHPTDAGYNKMAMELINQINQYQNA